MKANNDVKEKPQYKVIRHNAKPERRVVTKGFFEYKKKKYSREGEENT